MQVDAEKNLLYVRGQVPGHKGNFVLVKDAAKKRFDEQPERCFPTYLETMTDSVLYAPKSAHNPFEKRERWVKCFSYCLVLWSDTDILLGTVNVSLPSWDKGRLEEHH